MIDNPFSELMNDVVTLVKPDGTRLENNRASVQRDRIMVFDSSLIIDEGDTIERERPGGSVERYTVLDTGYSNEFHGIPAHYNLDVRKETALPRVPPGPSNTFYLSGPNSRVNSNSIDASVNISAMSSPQVFADLRSALNDVADVEQRALLTARVEEMESSQGSPGFLARYQAFMEAAANHMTVVGPFLPALSRLLG
jgi:hypothetical protein